VINEIDKSIQELARYLLPYERTGNLPLSIIQGVVHKVAGGALELFLPRETRHAGPSPIEGSSTLFPVTGVRYLNSYRPYAGDVVYCLRIGTDTIVLGSLMPKGAVDIWHEVGSSGEPAFLNSWVNYGSGFDTAAFWKQSDGWIHLKGLVKNGSSGGAVVFQLPVGYRVPDHEMYFNVVSNNVSAVVAVRPNGNVDCFLNGSTAFLCLDGIMFPSESAYNRDEWQTPRMDNNQPQDMTLDGSDPMFYVRPYDGVVFIQGVVTPTVASPLIILELPEKARRHRFLEMMAATGVGVARMAVGGSIPGFLHNDSGMVAGNGLFLGGLTYYGQMSYHLDDEWIPFPFASGWANYGSDWTSCAYRKEGQGVVWLSGLANRTAGTTLIGTLPEGYRPLATKIFNAIGNGNAQGRVDIGADGTVTAVVGGAAGFISLNGVKFRAMQ
jgi:hypothetical protein